MSNALSQASPNGALLRLESVAKTFGAGEVAVHALSDVSLEVGAGELAVMVGPSGSGKSTLLNIIGGLENVSQGRVWYRDRDITRFGARELTLYRRQVVGFVFQFYNLVPNLTARENVMVAAELSNNPLDVDEALRLVDLHARSDHFPSQLSGGEQQRVAIARAIAKNPELLLCDEPTGALDYGTGLRVLRILLDLKHHLGKTVVIITHNAAIAEIADRVVRMRSGKILELHANLVPKPPEEISW